MTTRYAFGAADAARPDTLDVASPVGRLPPEGGESRTDALAELLLVHAMGATLRGMERLAVVALARVAAGGPDLRGQTEEARARAGTAIADGPRRAMARRTARRALAGALPDETHGATRVHPLGESPAWARGRMPVATLGGWLLYH